MRKVKRKKKKKGKKKGAPGASREGFYEGREWMELRYQALQIYGRRCMCCGASPKNTNNIVLHVDHIKPRIKYPELELQLSNLQILCQGCNRGKSWKDETDFRMPQIATPRYTF